MNDETTRHALVQLLDDVGCEIFSYSGRAMYGAKCLAVSGKLNNIMADIVGACLLGGRASEMPEEECEAIEAAVRGMRTDSLGCDEVIYFPEVPYEGSEDDDADDAEVGS
jgi:hypothetical protein